MYFMSNKPSTQLLREWMDKVQENAIDYDVIKKIVRNWIEDPDSITQEKARVLLSTPEAQQCKKPRGSVIYRAIAVPSEQLEELLNGETIDLSPYSNRGFVAYSYSRREAWEAAYNFGSDDQIVVFHKQLQVNDLIIDFDELKTMLGMDADHRNEQELWMKDDPYYCHFSLADTDLNEDDVEQMKEELGFA
jgi:hypothetical protein